MIKKLTLLAMAVCALVAFAAPASANAELIWDTGEDPIGGEPGDEVIFHGTLSSTKGPLKISCDATATVHLWNGPTATGEVTDLTLTSHPTVNQGCTVGINVGGGTYVDVTNCEVDARADGLPGWAVTTAGSGSAHHATIDGAAFTNKFTGSGCLQHLNIPNNTEVSDKGNATGVVVDNCIVFNNAGTFEGGSTIDGELCATGDLRLTTIEE